MPRESLSHVDTAWLRMEDPSHPMVITIAMVFDTPFDRDRLKAVFQHRLLRFRRFRQRVVEPGQPTGRLYWEEDPRFDLDFHLQRISPPLPGDEMVLRDVVSELMSIPLDLSRPLWQFHFIEEVSGGWALVGRVHHCLGDGPALLHVLLSMTDGDFQQPSLEASEVQSSELAWQGVSSRVARTLAQEGLKALRSPRHLLGLVRMGAGSGRVVGKMLLRAPDPETVLRGQLGSVKQAAWSEPIELTDVKAIGRGVGGTVNDVMLAAVTGALRRYLQIRGEPVDGLSIRVGLSVDLRSPDSGLELGNRAGAVLVSLPIGITDPLERLREVKRRMDALKRSQEGAMIHGLLNALGMAPPDIQDVLAETYCTQDTAVMSNVAGPSQTIRMAGAPLNTLLFWVPAFGRVGLSLNAISYAGQIRLSVATDQGLVPDPERIIAGFEEEIETLLILAGRLETGQVVEVVSDGSVEAMNAMLDDALRTLDTLLEQGESHGG